MVVLSKKGATFFRAMRRWAVMLSVGLACSSGPDIQPCGLIPGSGCPIGRGGTCEDETCDALYDCVEGQWTLVESCAPSGSGGSSSSSAGGSGAGGCAGVSIDRTDEVTGGTPDPRERDCRA